MRNCSRESENSGGGFGADGAKKLESAVGAGRLQEQTDRLSPPKVNRVIKDVCINFRRFSGSGKTLENFTSVVI